MSGFARAQGLTLLAMLMLSACTATTGAQKPVLSAKALDEQMAKFSPSDVLHEDERLAKNPDERRAYRATVAGMYIAAIDRRYKAFFSEIGQERKGLKAGSSVLGVGLGTIGALVSGGASKVLSGVGAGVAGGSAAIDKEIFYEQTLPALKRVMDAERTKVRYRIFSGLATPDASAYPTVLLLSDLSDYEGAGSIDGAIAALSAAAGEKADAEQKNFQAQFNAASLVRLGTAETPSLNRAIREALTAITDPDKQRAALNRAFAALEADASSKQVLADEQTRRGIDRTKADVAAEDLRALLRGTLLELDDEQRQAVLQAIKNS
jgi:hypothetical protein